MPPDDTFFMADLFIMQRIKMGMQYQKLFFAANRALQEHTYISLHDLASTTLQEKHMPKRHQQRLAKEQAGRNNPRKGTVITTGTPRKKETVREEAAEHK